VGIASILTSDRLLRERSGSLSAAVIVDARRRGAYAEGHIPGAIRMGWEDWCAPAPAHAVSALQQKGYWGALASLTPEEFRDRLEAAGLSSDRPIVVYGDGPATRGREGRIAWMLLYLGARDVALLDGGWSGWLAAGGDSSADVPVRPRGRFEVHLDPRRRRTLEELRRAPGGEGQPVYIDTRSEAEFAGQRDEYLPRRGRIPGAALVPFGTYFTEDGRYTQPPDVPPHRPAVAYCEVGVRAALFALLHEIHTGEIIPVYDGSFMEWSLDPELPVDV
jgi:thiosulfate/3-mercaptopyruvate sulfurtransferase